MPLIWRFAPPSPNMNMSPPITIATSASERANGPVNVCSRLPAARSHGDCACRSAGATSTAVTTANLNRQATRASFKQWASAQKNCSKQLGCLDIKHDAIAELLKLSDVAMNGMVAVPPIEVVRTQFVVRRAVTHDVVRDL